MRFTAGRAADRRLFRARWRLDGLPPSELLGLMRDSAVVSGWARRDGRLKKAFAEDPSGHKSLESDGDPAEVLASQRSHGGRSRCGQLLGFFNGLSRAEGCAGSGCAAA